MRFSISLLSVLSSVLVIFPSSGPVQQNATADKPPANRKPVLKERRSATAERRIVLDVVVTDKSGKPVARLREQDFSLLDQNVPRTFSFHPSEQIGNTSDLPPDPPMQAILVVDAENASALTVSYETQQLQRFLRRGRLPIPMSVVVFTDTSTRTLKPDSTIDGNALADSLRANPLGLRAMEAGANERADRIQRSIYALEKIMESEEKKAGRKLLIWVSPGWPFLSAPNVDLTDRERRMLFDNVVLISQELNDARITLYSVDPTELGDAGSLRTVDFQSFLKGVTAANKVEYGDIALPVLATQSGGLVLNSGNSFLKLVETPLRDAEAFYTFSFDAPRAGNPDEYHSLEVKINRPGMTARTRTGYYAQP